MKPAAARAIAIAGKQQIELAALRNARKRQAYVDALVGIIGARHTPTGDMIAGALHEKTKMNLSRHDPLAEKA